MINKAEFQIKITERVAHLDYYDQSMCRAALVGMMLALLDVRHLEIIYNAFDEYVDHYYSEPPALRIMKRHGSH